MVSRFHWGNFFGLEDDGRSGHQGWAYTLILLAKYGDQPRKSDFYNLKLMLALEQNLWFLYQRNPADSFVKNFRQAYDIRFLECSANWLGLLNIERKSDPDMV